MNMKLTHPATNEQKQLIHRLKRKLRLDEDTYRYLVRQYSSGRTSTSAELTREEARQMISRMIDPEGKQKSEEQRKYRLVCRIYQTSCRISGLNAAYDSKDPQEREMNIAKLNMWLRQYGAVKKPVSRQSYAELNQTLRQLKAMEGKEA